MDILIGLQWGDEGKGKIIDLMSRDYDIIARFNGGANAGHSIYHHGERITLKLLPSGIFYAHIENIIGSAVVIDPLALKSEIDLVETLVQGSLENRIFISKKAHLVLPTQRYWDIFLEESPRYPSIGTTKNGIGPSYAHKALRQNVRAGDIHSARFGEDVYHMLSRQYDELEVLGQSMPPLEKLYRNFMEACEFMQKLQIIDTEIFLNQALSTNKKVLAEGAQATFLDIDHGTYPYVTSSNTIASAACVSLGVSPKLVNRIYGITKAYCTRVGNGIFPTEISDPAASDLREKGNEFGSNTKRPRRVGWLDLPALRYAVMLNGVTDLVLTKADILNGMATVPVCTDYDIQGKKTALASLAFAGADVQPIWKFLPGWNDTKCEISDPTTLPEELRAFVSYLEEDLNVPVKYLSVGPLREQLITLAH